MWNGFVKRKISISLPRRFGVMACFPRRFFPANYDLSQAMLTVQVLLLVHKQVISQGKTLRYLRCSTLPDSHQEILNIKYRFKILVTSDFISNIRTTENHAFKNGFEIFNNLIILVIKFKKTSKRPKRFFFVNGGSSDHYLLYIPPSCAL